MHEQRLDHKLYFLHIEKTAGLSLTSILDSYFPRDRVFPFRFWGEGGATAEDRIEDFQFIRGHYTYALHSLLQERPHYMTMLREPVARVISHYNHALRDPVYYPYHDVRRENMTLSAFLENPATKHLGQNWQTRCIALDVNLRNFIGKYDARNLRRIIDQIAVDMPDDEMLKIAKRHLDEFWFVGITERFFESLAVIVRLLGWHPLDQIPKVNTAPKSLAISEVSEDVLERIREYNQLDIELYEYAQGLFQSRVNSVIEELLQMYYTLEAHPLPADQVDVTFEQPIIGSGWYPPEQTAEDMWFRWTGLSGESTLFQNLSTARSLRVTLFILAGITPQMLDELMLFVNNERIALSHTTDRGMHVSSGVVPAQVLQRSGGNVTKFSLRTPSPISPKEINLNNDQRRLGVAVARMIVQPLDGKSNE